MSSLLVELQYFMPVNLISALSKKSHVIFEQYENFQKMSFRNRCVVAGSNGAVHLSVPLEKGRGQRELMKEVRISQHEDWQKQHWRTIESCYSRSPFFEFYRDEVFELLQKRQVFLLDMNLAILQWLQKVLANRSVISLTASYEKHHPASGRHDLRNRILPKNFQEQAFPFRYTQVFEDRIGFLPNLSILDLLFCCGPNAKTLLKDSKISL